MAVNSFKQDENLTEVSKIKTLGRLFFLSARTQATYFGRTAYHGILRIC